MIIPDGVSEDEAYLQYVDWRPMSTDVIYVYNNDIRMRRLDSKGKLGDEIRLTNSGVPGYLKTNHNVLCFLEIIILLKLCNYTHKDNYYIPIS